MFWKTQLTQLKTANINLHVVATGGGAGLQQLLWAMPGSSAYLSGASFPYDTQEQIDLLGFTPESFCSEENAVDLASVAYMKAYKFGGKDPVGLGITASVASEKIHRGDHRIFVCVITNTDAKMYHMVLEKGIGEQARKDDGLECDHLGFLALLEVLGIENGVPYYGDGKCVDASEMVRERFFMRPFFGANGRRLKDIPAFASLDKSSVGYKPYALMSGAFNPPHPGHYGVADKVLRDYGKSVVFEITATPPAGYKNQLTVQMLLQRAKLMQGHDTLFTEGLPLFLDKAFAYYGIPLVVGADAMVRMLDPKWGKTPKETLESFRSIGTHIYVADRDGHTRKTIAKSLGFWEWSLFNQLTSPVSGDWKFCSTDIRNKVYAGKKDG